jgi:hypothetical protein
VTRTLVALDSVMAFSSLVTAGRGNSGRDERRIA